MVAAMNENKGIRRKENPARPVTDSKKSYTRPVLTEWGSVHELTHGDPPGQVVDFPFANSRPLE